MGFRLKNSVGVMPILPIFPGASTLYGFVGATDEDKLLLQSLPGATLMPGSTADIAKLTGILGAVTSVPTATTPGSTANPIYFQPYTPFDVIEADYSTATANTTSFLVVTTNIGYFFGVSHTTTIAGAANIDPSKASTSAGSSDAFFFRMLGFSTSRGVMYGLVNSSHLALS